MSISTSWREQYERMLRSHVWLQSVALGDVDRRVWPDEARDALYHFFQDAYHLKDWLKNDQEVRSPSVEKFIKVTLCMRIAADLANGSKHYRLDERSKTRDPSTAVARQTFTVLGNASGSQTVAVHSWSVRSNDEQYDACELADLVAGEWQRWLRKECLLP